jgi:putative peptide zinc metalloprotease protein
VSTPAPPKKQFFLRKLRRGITLKFNGYDNDGIPQWLMHDPARNSFYIIGWPEHEMLSHWHLRDPKKIIEVVNNKTTLHVTPQDFDDLLTFLNKNYLLEQRWYNVFKKAKEQKVIKRENLFYWFIRYYLFFRVPLLHPDNFLNKTAWFGNVLFHKYTAYVMIILGATAIYQIGQQWEVFTHTFSTMFSWEGLFFYFIAFSFVKFFHELGHAYMCKRYGVSVPTMGIAFLVFWPILYTDTTLSWSLPSHQRLRVALAGMWIETYVTILAALIWCNVHNTVIQTVCYVTVALNWVSTFLINVSPFMRFDGYYAASDLLKVPNLQPRAFALAKWQMRNWLFGWEEPLEETFSPKLHWTLVTYAFITWIYRLFIYFGIAVLVYHYFFKVVGIILFAIELFAFILKPIVNEIQVWYNLRKQFTLNKNIIITGSVAFLVLLLLSLTLNTGIKLYATLNYNHQFLFSPQDSAIQTPLPPSGTPVKGGQTIVVLKSLELDKDLLQAKAKYEKTKAELRRASLNLQYSDQTDPLMAALSQTTAEYNRLLNLQHELTIKAPFDAVIGDVDPSLKSGTTIMKNEWIADIINPNKLKVDAYVEESDLNQIKIGAKGYFYPLNLSEAAIPVTVTDIEPTNVTNLNPHFSKEIKLNKPFIVDTPSYLASEFGGKIPVEVSEEGQYVPIDSYYRVILKTQKPIKLSNVKTGVVILTGSARSYIVQLFYKLKQVFIKESDF